jgi:two-component system response regulator QseB
MSHKGTILVLDDDCAIAELLVEVLGDEGYAVHAVQDGTSARSAATAYHPDLVLLDLHIPGSSPADLIDDLKREDGIGTPIVLMSASPRAAEALLQDGILACLAKPFDLDELIACVERYIRRRGDAATGEGQPWPAAMARR